MSKDSSARLFSVCFGSHVFALRWSVIVSCASVVIGQKNYFTWKKIQRTGRKHWTRAWAVRQSPIWVLQAIVLNLTISKLDKNYFACELV